MKRIYYYYMALSGFFGLFILLMLWNTVLAPPEHLPVALVLLFCITPILIPFRGLLNANLKSCIWMSFISLFYFTHGVAEAFITTPEELYYALLEVFFSLLLCAGTAFYVYKTEKIK